jgi:hypothetical protein
LLFVKATTRFKGSGFGDGVKFFLPFVAIPKVAVKGRGKLFPICAL